ncbi:DUF4189 domain-containing protein [Glaciimonas soli]|uniref:DUF4189 domain-containing protein n=1 Tax=Glaciimonas soli TaxID=2590999 RepID=A0A843YUQ3_9BURK|nr:DUF4189 domain-containing protein [Glaciimonas soli]
MKAFTLMCLMLVMSAMSLHANAQSAGCAPGDILSTAGGVSTCLPGNGPPPEQSQSLEPPPPRWESRWGAIASDEPHGVLGVSIDQLSQSAAERAAMTDCKQKGGVACKIEIPYQNGCVAFTVSDSGYNAAADSTIEKASQRGMSTCKSAGANNCHTYYTACSRPVQVH